MNLALIAMLASSSVATGTVNIQVSVAYRASIRLDDRRVRVALNSRIKFQTRNEGRVVIVVPE
jgi:hypothetical protein